MSKLTPILAEVAYHERTNDELKRFEGLVKGVFLELVGEDDRDYSNDSTDKSSKLILTTAACAANDLRRELRERINEL